MPLLTRSHRLWLLLATTLASVATPAIGVVPAKASRGPVFEVRFDARLLDHPFSGRVIFFLNSDTDAEPRRVYGWTSREPIFSQDVRDWKPDTPMRFERLAGYPYEPGKLPAGKYAVQAVMHTNADLPHSGKASGNLYSKEQVIDWNPSGADVVRLSINRKVKSAAVEVNTEYARTVKLRSACLTRFHGRDIFLRCTVAMPEAYQENDATKFPVIYAIPGFGGDDREALMYASMLGTTKAPFVRVGLDATCPLGHHVFADSENNGPYGRALVEELIPHLEKEFRLIPEATARFLIGHSSGGWSALWLQIEYPDYFGGVWATAPDAVDFHDFSGINVYATDANLYKDADGNPRPIMRQGSKVLLHIEDFSRKEDVLGPGGQLASFEAVFSPRGADGMPKRLWDRETGRIDPNVARAWRKYDIVDKLRREWKEIGPLLTGKVTVITGEKDNFYLEGAAKLLKIAFAELGSDARVYIEQDKDHQTVLFSKPVRRIPREINKTFMASNPEN